MIEENEDQYYGDPLNLDHLNVDKMNFRDIIEYYEGDRRIYTFPKPPLEHHPV